MEGWFVIDGYDRVVDVGGDSNPHLEAARGQNLWDAYPGSRASVMPSFYEEARTNGSAARVFSHGGRLIDLRIVRLGGSRQLRVHYRDITLAGLVSSLHDLVDPCAAGALRRSNGSRGARHGHLQVVR